MNYIENEENNAIVNTEPHDSEVAPSLVAEGGKQYGEELSANPKGFGYTKQFFVSELPVTGIPDAIYLIQQSDGKYNGFVWNIAYQRFDKVYSGAIPQFKGADGERATPVREVVAPKESVEKIFKGKVAFNDDVYYKGQLLGQDEKGGEGLKIYDIAPTTNLAQLVANYPMPCIANTYGMYVVIDIKHTLNPEKYTGEIESLSGPQRYVVNTDQNPQLGTIFNDPKYRKDYLVEGDSTYGTVEIEYGEFVNNQVSLTIPAIQQDKLATNEVGYIKLVAAHTTPTKIINLFRVGIPSYSGGTSTSYKLVFSGIVDEDGTDPVLYTAIFTKDGSTYTATLYRKPLSTSVVDDALSPTSTNPVQNKVITNKINEIINGSQPVGVALTSKQLENVSDESGSYQNAPFNLQATGTDNNITETPTAPVAKHLELRGNSVVWNQLVSNNTTSLALTEGHVYLTDIGGEREIITAIEGQTLTGLTGGTDQVFDLTLMYGAGKEPSTVLEFNRDYPLPYYSYNVGQIISCKTEELVTVGYNQFESLDTDIDVVAGQTYRLMYWNGTALANITSGSVKEYDGAKNLIKTTAYGSLSDLHTLDSDYPDNGDKGIKLDDATRYVQISGVGNSNILFNIAWDGSRSDYEEYVEHSYSLPNVELKRAGAAYDEITPDGTYTKRIDVIANLGNLITAETVADANGVLQIDVSSLGFKANTSYLIIYNLLSSKYEPDTYTNVYNAYSKNSIAFVNDTLCIQDDNLIGMVSADIKDYLNNVVVQFELETPIEASVSSFAENIEVDDFGTMQFVSAYTESASNPIVPQGNRFFYPADYVLLVDDLNTYVNGDVKKLGFAEGTLNVINASDIVNNTLTDAQYALITNGKPTLISGTLFGLRNPILLTDNGGSSTRRGFAFSGVQMIAYSINASTKVIAKNSATSNNLQLTNISQINGKLLPSFPTDTAKQYKLVQKVGGDLDWVEDN